jgi:hypothetical protein
MNRWSTAVVRVALTAMAASMMAAALAGAQAGSPIQSGAERQSASQGPGAPGLCGALAFCYETSSFATRISDFQAILQNGNTKTLTVRLSFRNKHSRPLTLGYVAGSGIATDDRGHKYLVDGDRAVQGIGVIQGMVADQKFVLQPGETADARFEFVWNTSPQEIFGLSFQVDLAIREIDPIPGNQLRLGREHALHFSGLGNRAPAPSRMTTEPLSSGPSGGAPASAAPVPPPVGPCVERPRCYNAGPFAAEVTGLTASFSGGGNAVHVIKANVRFRNLTVEPVVLGYLVDSAVVTDNYGNRYQVQGNQRGDGASGIGMVTRVESDPQFILAPGASGNATFTMSRYRRETPIGSTFAFDLTIAQLEVLPSRQVRTIREHSVGFTQLSGSVASVATTAPVSAAPGGPPSPVDGCGGKPRCFSADPFVAEVTGLTASFSGNGNAVHVLKASVRFRNTTNQPVVLGYMADSAVVTDNNGNRYQAQVNQRGDGAAGIGTVTRANANPQFVLAPGASRDATFTVSRYKRDSRIGSTFTVDLTIAHLEVLPGEQIRVLREYAVGFTALTAGGGSFLERLLQPPPR